MTTTIDATLVGSIIIDYQDTTSDFLDNNQLKLRERDFITRLTAGELFAEEYTITAATETIDLESLTNNWGTSVDIAEAKLLYIYSKSTSTGLLEIGLNGNHTTGEHVHEINPEGFYIIGDQGSDGIPQLTAATPNVLTLKTADTVHCKVIIIGEE